MKTKHQNSKWHYGELSIYASELPSWRSYVGRAASLELAKHICKVHNASLRKQSTPQAKAHEMKPSELIDHWNKRALELRSVKRFDQAQTYVYCALDLQQALKEHADAKAEGLRDSERLDWLDKNRTAHIYEHFKYNSSNAATQKTWRDAIDAAMASNVVEKSKI